jgi:hypothetical protein
MTVITLHPATGDAEVRERRHRATSLRAQARQLEPVLANAYRRRASELELEAFLIALQSDDVTGAPAA